MINGLELIEARNRQEQVDLDQLEKKYTITLPPIFRSFAKHFKWKKDLIEEQDFWFIRALDLGEINFRCQTIEEHFRYTYEMEDEDIDERGYLLIGSCHYGAYLGTKGKEADKIIMGTGSTRGSYKVVDDNIFDFLSGITTNLQEYALSTEEYRELMLAKGYDGEDLDYQMNYWNKNFKGK